MKISQNDIIKLLDIEGLECTLPSYLGEWKFDNDTIDLHLIVTVESIILELDRIHNLITDEAYDEARDKIIFLRRVFTKIEEGDYFFE